MKTLRKMKENSAYFGTIPEGCKYCGPGQKMVLLITGKCTRRCFYCPLSFRKRGKNVIYANELKVLHLAEIISEAHAISALGTGITGGEPMMVPEATFSAIKLLKNEFGFEHHIHLYTTGDFDAKYIKTLADAGLDELRFHTPIATWPKKNPELEHKIKLAKKEGIAVGVELPVIPGMVPLFLRFTKYLDSIGAEFLNLNELEFSESNWRRFQGRGYVQKGPISNSVKGSEDDAFEILRQLAAHDKLNIGVHYCSARFKDRQQLTNRLRRRAKNVKRPFEVITDEPTFLLGIIEYSSSEELAKIKTMIKELQNTYEIPDALLNYHHGAHRLELAPWVLKELENAIPSSIKKRSYIVEEYPTADRLEVERIPLDDFR
ncbi:radical SAM protein [[Eubacterium] cellulosolvens]